MDVDFYPSFLEAVLAQSTAGGPEGQKRCPAGLKGLRAIDPQIRKPMPSETGSLVSSSRLMFTTPARQPAARSFRYSSKSALATPVIHQTVRRFRISLSGLRLASTDMDKELSALSLARTFI